MATTKIEWATHTSNWLAGCSKVSAACTNCYAESMTARLALMPDAPARYRDGVVKGRRWTGRVSYDHEALENTFKGLIDAKKARRVFINSMSDTFHADAPRESLSDLADEIRWHDETLRSGLTVVRSDHVIMLLTKRPGNLLAWQREYFPEGLPRWVWVGCTVEDQERADERIPLLLRVSVLGGGVRFLSMEPLVGPVDFRSMTTDPPNSGFACSDGFGRFDGEGPSGIHWVIAGGESGPKAGPSHPGWFRSLRDQCQEAGVPFHFKQWGEYLPEDQAHVLDDDAQVAILAGGGPPSVNVWDPPAAPVGICVRTFRVGKHAAGRLLDGVAHDGLPGVSP